MIKKIFVIMFLLAAPAMAEEIQFSGAVNQAPVQYPPLYKEKPSYDDDEPKSAPHEIKKNQTGEKRPPMTYSNFPQNYNSQDGMMMMQQMQNGMSGMMGY